MLGNNADIRLAGDQQLGDFSRATLVQRQVHARIVGLESLDDLRQGVARLRMRRGHDEMTSLTVGEVVGDAPQVLRIEENAIDHFGEFLARLGPPEDDAYTGGQQRSSEIERLKSDHPGTADRRPENILTQGQRHAHDESHSKTRRDRSASACSCRAAAKRRSFHRSPLLQCTKKSDGVYESRIMKRNT